MVSGFAVSRRPAPSAGGLHSIDMLLVEDVARPTLQLYDARSHVLWDLEVPREGGLHELVKEAGSATRSSGGSIVLFFANFERTLSKYENGESLLWRDSGALLGLCYLVAEGLGVQCCGLGITGEPWLSQVIGSHSGAGGVGGCIVGVGGGER